MSWQAVLEPLLRSRVTAAGWSWFERTRADAVSPLNTSHLLAAYTGATRTLGKAVLQIDDDERRLVHAHDADISLSAWGVQDLSRAVLLLSVAASDADQFVTSARACYENGDAEEQRSWLAALSLLPDNEQFLDSAVDACRTNIVSLFESIACDNPYPSRRFPELNFNQMVLKALFNSIAISRIVGLSTRFNRELSRMASDYVSEREAAARAVPADIWLVVAPYAGPEDLKRMRRYLCHQDPDQRYWAALALGRASDAASRTALERQRDVESEPRVAAVLDAALATTGGTRV